MILRGMRGLPVELRERIISAHLQQGMAVSEIADVFQVSVTSVRRYIKLAKAGRSLTPVTPPGGQKKLGAPEHQWVLAEIQQSPFTTSYELTAKYNQKFPANQVHRSTILRAMHQLGFTHKKNTSSAAARARGCGAETCGVREDSPNTECRGPNLH